jgi:hypothetical protein
VLRRSNLAKNFQFEELYDGDISSVQIATCRSNSEKVVVKAFKRDKLQHRLDLQHKVRRQGTAGTAVTDQQGSRQGGSNKRMHYLVVALPAAGRAAVIRGSARR